jgi:hypothetical protein
MKSLKTMSDGTGVVTGGVFSAFFGGGSLLQAASITSTSDALGTARKAGFIAAEPYYVARALATAARPY